MIIVKANKSVKHSLDAERFYNNLNDKQKEELNKLGINENNLYIIDLFISMHDTIMRFADWRYFNSYQKMYEYETTEGNLPNKLIDFIEDFVKKNGITSIAKYFTYDRKYLYSFIIKSIKNKLNPMDYVFSGVIIHKPLNVEVVTYSSK